MIAAPASWTPSAISRSQGTISSFHIRRLEKTGGLSSEVEADPAVIVRAIPARARSI
jgi:hypothetical protein